MASDVGIRLSSGAQARLTPDPFVAGALTLSIDGVDQSHVSLRDPRGLFYDYVRRLGTAIDLVSPAASPLFVVHLGAGALTLARYVAETRPGSPQLVIENEVGLVAFVLGAAPLPRGERVSLIEADALDGLRLAAVLPIDGVSWHGTANIVLCDVYAGVLTPPHLVNRDFYLAVAELLAPSAVVLVNVADDAGLRHTVAQSEALGDVFPHVAVVGPSAVLDGSEAGNTVLLASFDRAVIGRMPALALAGPHPASWRVVFSPWRP